MPLLTLKKDLGPIWTQTNYIPPLKKWFVKNHLKCPPLVVINWQNLALILALSKNQPNYWGWSDTFWLALHTIEVVEELLCLTSRLWGRWGFNLPWIASHWGKWFLTNLSLVPEACLPCLRLFSCLAVPILRDLSFVKKYAIGMEDYRVDQDFNKSFFYFSNSLIPLVYSQRSTKKNSAHLESI